MGNQNSSTFEVEKAGIERITFSDRYLGFFEMSESVFLEIDYKEKRKNSYTYTLEIINGWGDVCDTRSITAEDGEDKCIVELGEFPLGWYRLLLKSESGELYNDYMAFVVVVDVADREYRAETLGADVAAEYEPKTMALGDEFVRTLSLQGLDWLRGRTDIRKWDEQIAEHRRALKRAGFKMSSVSTDDGGMMPKIREIDLRDVYEKYKNGPALNDVTNDVYEIMNETDISFGRVALPDTLTAYCKAAFIGLRDSCADPLTSMTSTALCSDSFYYDNQLQNGILDYSNIYNFHGYEGIESKAAFSRKVSLAYSPEGSIRPTFMTENGKKVWAGEDTVAHFDQLQIMCRYAIKSCAKILAEGCDKWFWFIVRAFLEMGGGFGNAHAWTHQPYPIAAVLSNLTYQMGKGIYKGRFSFLPEKSYGYLFDRGDCDVAIMFSGKNENITLRADSVTIIDMFGAEAEVCAGEEGEIFLSLSEVPFFVRFPERCPEELYYETSYQMLECEKLSFSDPQRIVLNPVWEDQDLTKSLIMQKGYLFAEEDKQRVDLRIFNLSDKTMSGRAYVNLEYPEHFDVEFDAPDFTVEPMGRVDLSIVIKTTGKAKMNSMGDILFGAKLEDGSEVSSAVCRYWFKLDDMEIRDEDIRVFEGFTFVENWNIKNIMYPGSMSFESKDDEITIKADHGGEHAVWYFPEFFVKDASIFKGADGIILRRKHSHNVSTKLTAFICTNDGRAYWSGDASGVPYTDDWKTIVYPWDTFVLFASPEGFNDPRPFDPNDIYKVRIGASGTPKGFIPDTTVRDFGIFYDRMGATRPHPNTIVLEGIDEGAIYDSSEGLSLVATLPQDAAGDVRVFLGKTAYGNFAVDGSKVYVDLSGLDRGEYTLQVSCKTAVNYRYAKYVSFYVEN